MRSLCDSSTACQKTHHLSAVNFEQSLYWKSHHEIFVALLTRSGHPVYNRHYGEIIRRKGSIGCIYQYNAMQLRSLYLCWDCRHWLHLLNARRQRARPAVAKRVSGICFSRFRPKQLTGRRCRSFPRFAHRVFGTHKQEFTMTDKLKISGESTI